MSDDSNDAPADNSALLCNALIVVTGVILIGAVLVIQNVLKNHYPGIGWFG